MLHAGKMTMLKLPKLAQFKRKNEIVHKASDETVEIVSIDESASNVPREEPKSKPKVKYIYTLEQISKTLEDAAHIFAESGYSAGIDYLNSIRFSTGYLLDAYPPLSIEYRQCVLKLYEAISGRVGYQPEQNEQANLSIEDALLHPWPFQSQSAEIVGSYFMGVAHLTRVLGAYDCKKVFEYGTGWGHTALLMARAGIDITACDIEPVFLEKLAAEAAKDGIPLKTFLGRFGDLPDQETFDAFVFYECFHHCLDFIDVVPKLRSRLNPKGKILLGGEPMLADGEPPWGLRTDGHALWAIRTHGWMELGFREDFLKGFFDLHGFDCTTHPCEASGNSGFIYTFHRRD